MRTHCKAPLPVGQPSGFLPSSSPPVGSICAATDLAEDTWTSCILLRNDIKRASQHLSEREYQPVLYISFRGALILPRLSSTEFYNRPVTHRLLKLFNDTLTRGRHPQRKNYASRVRALLR